MAMTLQEIYDKVKAHLLTQMTKSENEDFCMYRDFSGRKCAIGCLITDEHYDRRCEKQGPVGENVWRALRESGVVDQLEPPKDCDHPLRRLLCRLQGIHDGYTPSHWEDELEASARNFGLVP